MPTTDPHRHRRRRRRGSETGGAARGFLVALAVLAVVAAAGLMVLRGVGPFPDPEGCTVEVGEVLAELSIEQAENAAIIAATGVRRDLPARAVSIALATAYQESKIRNLDHGDRDSLGLFQQRPSQGWGTPEQIMDADRSTRVFFGGPSDPNGAVTRGLLDIPGWESLSFTAAAQAVQISAYPDRYGQWESQAYAWLALYS